MDVYTWVIFMYVAGTAVIAWFLLHEILPRKNKESFVGPSYWGSYHDSREELAIEKTIKLHESETDQDGLLCSGSAYTAIKSARV